MTRLLRIVVADDEVDMRDYFEKILPRMGHQVVAVSKTGNELVAACLEHQPDLAITDIKMPEMDEIEASTRIFQQAPIPIILVSAYHDQKLIERAEKNHILAYLVKPIKQADLEAAIAIASGRFEQFQCLQRETNDPRRALADRKLVERAQGILMKKAQLDEQQAFRRLQKLASENNRKLVEIAQAILIAEEALAPENHE